MAGSILRLVAAAFLAALIFAIIPATATAHHCTTHSCATLKAAYRHTCYRHARSWYRGHSNYTKIRARKKVMVCQIKRAARHFHQSSTLAFRVVRCETGRTFDWFLQGAHQGAWQYLWSTWRSTPYAHRSPYSPKWSTLATMWMWSQGRRGEWQC